MTVLESNNHIINVRATLVARLYFAQEFDDELQDALKIILDYEASDDSISDAALKVIWAMHKAESKANGKSTPNFRQWLAKHSKFDIRDCMDDFLQEIVNGFLINKINDETPENTSIEKLTQYLITVAIRLGISMDELNELTTQGLYDILQIFADANGNKGGGAKVATPAQNEAFWR